MLQMLIYELWNLFVIIFVIFGIVSVFA